MLFLLIRYRTDRSNELILLTAPAEETHLTALMSFIMGLNNKRAIALCVEHFTVSTMSYRGHTHTGESKTVPTGIAYSTTEINRGGTGKSSQLTHKTIMITSGYAYCSLAFAI